MTRAEELHLIIAQMQYRLAHTPGGTTTGDAQRAAIQAQINQYQAELDALGG